MIPIVTPTEMSAIDAAAPVPTDVLVARAGAEVAIAARRMLGGTYGRRVLVATGKGNNGADGRVAASVLARWGVRCEVATPPGALELVAAAHGRSCAPWNLVIDAAYGTGLRGPWGADQAPPVPVLAVDIPSGIDALTGADHGCWQAAATVTFGALKPGLLLPPGATAAGEVQVAPIGLDATSAAAWLMTDADADAVLPTLPPSTHKWRRAVRVIAGSPQMRGAGHLVCAGAQQAGAGMVVISSPGLAAASVSRPTETVARNLRPGRWAAEALDGIDRFDAAVIGPGIGVDPTSAAQIAAFIESCPVPLVVDADALAAVAEHPDCLRARTAATVLTPHDGEFTRLTGAAPAADRFGSVRQAAADLGAVVLAKGPATLVASPVRPDASTRPAAVLAVTAGTARLATAGSGDVLSGVIAASLSGGAADPETLLSLVAAAAHWHGRTASCEAAGPAAASVPLLAAAQVGLLEAARIELARSQPGRRRP